MQQETMLARQSDKQYERFLRRVCETGRVWSLNNDEGFVTTDSAEYENEEGEALVLFCFWAEREDALACAVEGWEVYRPAEIPLGEFIEKWCVWMSDDEMLAGIDFDSALVGREQEPLQLVLDLAGELERQGKSVQLGGFESLGELVDIIRRLPESNDDSE